MVFIVVVAICISFLMNITKLKKELYQEAKNYAMDINEQVAANISYRMNTDLYLVEELSETISMIPKVEICKQILERKKEVFGLDEILIFNQDEILLPSTYNWELIKRWQEQHPKIWDEPTISYMPNHEILFSAPIKKGNEKTGYVVLAMKSYLDVQEVMAKANYQEDGLNLLMDVEGNLIAGPVGSYALTVEEMEDLHRKMITALVSRLKDDNGVINQGFTMDLLQGEKVLISAHALGINDWMQVSVTPWSLKEKEYSYYLLTYFWLVMLAGVVATGIIAYIISLKKQARMKLEKIAYCDLLTGGITNDAFQIQCLDHLRRTNWSSYGIIYLNLCDFKYINERWGIDRGNEALRYIHNTFQENITDDELVARSEIDHFFLLLHGDTEEALTKRVLDMIQKINMFSSQCLLDHYQLQFMVGGCMVEQHGVGLQSLQDRARRAAQFHEEKNICVFYNAHVIKKIERENKLNALFEDSLKNHDFEVYLQPKVYLQQNRPCAAEALVRWNHPEEGMIFPSDFIPLFEQNGKICKLDFYMFEEVCKIIDRWRRENRPLSEISVNISREHIKKMDVAFAHEYCAIKDKYDIPDGVIQIELTETSMFYAQQMPCVTEAIRIFHKGGFSCALDDFGFGYSSLSTLNEFNVDTIKLDRSFFVNENKKSRIVVANMIQLAHDMDIQIVAEGIEDEEQVNVLCGLGCDLIQGYYYSKPIPVSAFEVWQDRAQGIEKCERMH